MKLHELNPEELKNVDGGFLLLGSGGLQPHVLGLNSFLGVDKTDEQGKTENTTLGLNLDNLFASTFA